MRIEQGTVLRCSWQRFAAQPAPVCAWCVVGTLCSQVGWSRCTLRGVKSGFGGCRAHRALLEMAAHVCPGSRGVQAGRARGSSVSPATAPWHGQGLFTSPASVLSGVGASCSARVCFLCLSPALMPRFRWLAVIAAFPRLGSAGCSSLTRVSPGSLQAACRALAAGRSRRIPKLCVGCSPCSGFSFPFGCHPKRGKAPNQGGCKE